MSVGVYIKYNKIIIIIVVVSYYLTIFIYIPYKPWPVDSKIFLLDLTKS